MYLPFFIIKYILSYDNNYVIRHGEIIQIKKLDKQDERYKLLKKVSFIKFKIVNLNFECVKLPITKNKDYCISSFNSILTISIINYDKELNTECSTNIFRF